MKKLDWEQFNPETVNKGFSAGNFVAGIREGGVEGKKSHEQLREWFLKYHDVSLDALPFSLQDGPLSVLKAIRALGQLLDHLGSKQEILERIDAVKNSLNKLVEMILGSDDVLAGLMLRLPTLGRTKRKPT